MTTRARIHSTHQQHTRRVGDRTVDPADGDGSVFQRLAQDIQARRAELRQLVKEEDTEVGEAEFARPRQSPAADQAGVADRVVGRAEGAVLHQRQFGRQQASDAVDGGHFQRLLRGERRQDAG